MSYRYWTADLHMGHGNICIYCARPWIRPGDLNENGWWTSDSAAQGCADRMTDGLVANMNARIKPEDSVVHVGDFRTRGRAAGTPGGTPRSVPELQQALRGHWSHVLGNHDRNNGVTHGALMMLAALGNKIALVRHHPIDPSLRETDHNLVALNFDFVICGHVHEKWQTRTIAGVPHVNVGVDANRYYPITDSEVLGLLARELRKTKSS